MNQLISHPHFPNALTAFAKTMKNDLNKSRQTCELTKDALCRDVAHISINRLHVNRICYLTVLTKVL